MKLHVCVFRERPGSDEQKALDEQKVPLLLNFSQCQLIKGNWYEVIQHTTDALAIQPGWFLWAIPFPITCIL